MIPGWALADTVFGIPIDQINAITQLGFAGGAVFVIALFILGKLVAGFLLDRAEKRADDLQKALDAANLVNQQVPKAIADLTSAHEREVKDMTSSHEREVASLTAEVRRLQEVRP